MASNTPKADAIAAAQKQRQAASDRWSAAVPDESAKFERAKSGEQLARLAHADALEELREAHVGTLNADDAMNAANALPADQPAA